MTIAKQLHAPKRLSLPLTAEDIGVLEIIRASEQHLSALPGRVTADASESELVHAIFEAGLARVRESVDLVGYRELADDVEYTSYHAHRRAAAGRRRTE